MKNLKTRLTALALSAVVATQICSADIDTGLGKGIGGAVIDKWGVAHPEYGKVTFEKGENSATLTFNDSTAVYWHSLNLNGNETLNFNSTADVNSPLTIINKVGYDTQAPSMSRIYGTINSDGGIGKLVISNPNGILFDGAKFTAAGDVDITTHFITIKDDLSVNPVAHYNGSEHTFNGNGADRPYHLEVLNSEFVTGGELNFYAPTLQVINSQFKGLKPGENTTVRFFTENGKDYVAANPVCPGCTDYKEIQSMRLDSIMVDGDVYIVNRDQGIVKTVNGGKITGNLNAESNGSLSLNYSPEVINNEGVAVPKSGKTLEVGGDVDATAHGVYMFARDVKVDGNLNMTNDGGFIEVYNGNVGKDMNLTTLDGKINCGYKHFIHVNGETNVGGNANLNSEHNIHIGNYELKDTKKLTGDLLPGSFNVKGDLNAVANNGNIMTTINTTADNIRMESKNFGILSDDKALLSANSYEFVAKDYIGGLKNNDNAHTIIDTMENYKHVKANEQNNLTYMNIKGGVLDLTRRENGTVKEVGTNQGYGHINTLKTDDSASIRSIGDTLLDNADVKGDINFTASASGDAQGTLHITGNNVKATNINVGSETNYLKLDFDGRNFNTNYTNIESGKVVTIKGNEKITYELADGKYNLDSLKPSEDTTYLVSPEGKPAEVKPEPEVKPDEPIITPDDPEPAKPSNDDNVKVIRNVPDRITEAQPDTPVAFAADDDEDEAAGVRKNVDGSVTVVRMYPVY